MANPCDSNGKSDDEEMEDIEDDPESASLIKDQDRVEKEESNSDTSDERGRKALIGLRGLATLHVVIFHYLTFSMSNLHSPFTISSLASMEMPMFYLLAGYSLALAYGRQKYDGCTLSCCLSCQKTPQSSDNPQHSSGFASLRFYRNRFARLMPMYFISNFVIAAPLMAFGAGLITLTDEYFTFRLIFLVIASIFPISMWLPVPIFWPLSGPGWLVSTLWFFYLVFPFLLPKLQRYNRQDRYSKWIVYMFWVQLIVGYGLYYSLSLLTLPMMLKVLLDPLIAPLQSWCSTGWGLSRLPVFTMGLLAGLLRVDNQPNPYVGNSSDLMNFIFAWIPLPSKCNIKGGEVASEAKWARLVTCISTSHIVTIVIFAVLGIFVPDVLKDVDMNLHIQFVGVHSLLIVVDGLTRDGGKSFLSRVCQTAPLQQLGRIAMTLYLIHMSLILWLSVAVGGEKEIRPVWGIPLVLVVSLLFAWVLTKYVEEPLCKVLRVR